VDARGRRQVERVVGDQGGGDATEVRLRIREVNTGDVRVDGGALAGVRGGGAPRQQPPASNYMRTACR